MSLFLHTRCFWGLDVLCQYVGVLHSYSRLYHQCMAIITWTVNEPCILIDLTMMSHKSRRYQWLKYPIYYWDFITVINPLPQIVLDKEQQKLPTVKVEINTAIQGSTIQEILPKLTTLNLLPKKRGRSRTVSIPAPTQATFAMRLSI